MLLKACAGPLPYVQTSWMREHLPYWYSFTLYMTIHPFIKGRYLGVSARVREPRRRLRAPRDARPQPKEHESTSQANTASARVHSETSWLNLLVSKLTAMSDRIRTLEDALQQEYSIHQTLRRLLNSRASSFDFEIDDTYLEADRINTKEKFKEAEVYPDDSVPDPTHPLLSLELLEIKNGIEAYVTYPDENDGFNIATGHEDSTSEMIDAFGVLTIRDGHRVGFSGASAPEVCSSFS